MRIERAAEEVFKILRSYDYEVSLYDEEGKQVYEPNEACRFFDKKMNLQVSIIDDGDDSKIRLYFRKDIPANMLSGLMQTLRTSATKYNMVFDCQKQDGAISPKDFATKISVAEARSEMNITEGMYGTSRSSYLRLENARMIVRHSDKINEDLMGARGRNIDSIYIENGVGERFLFPTVQLAPARALAHHISNGGSWTDEGGDNICNLAKDYADLRAMSRHIYLNANNLEENAQGVRGKVREGVRKLRRTFESICRKTRYEDVMQSLKKPLTEAECDLSEAIANLKKTCTVEGREIDDRVYETCARCINETDQAEDAERYTRIAGVRIARETWNDFKKGHLALSDAPMTEPDVEGYRSFCGAALTIIADHCENPEMAELMKHVADEFATMPELDRGPKVFAAKALEIVGWKVPSSVAPTAEIKELATWIDNKNASKVTEVENIKTHDHFGELVRDLKRAKIRFGYDVNSNILIVPNNQCNRVRAWLRDNDFSKTVDNVEQLTRYFLHTPTAILYVLDKADGLDKNVFELKIKPIHAEQIKDTGITEDLVDEEPIIAGRGEHDVVVDLGDDDDGELSMADIILPTNQADALSREVSVATVPDFETGEEELPSTDYISRLRTLSGVGNGLNRVMY